VILAAPEKLARGNDLVFRGFDSRSGFEAQIHRSNDSNEEAGRGMTASEIAEIARRQPATAGIPRERIFTGAPRTLCEPNFHSIRRDRTEERMYSVIGIREAV